MKQWRPCAQPSKSSTGLLARSGPDQLQQPDEAVLNEGVVRPDPAEIAWYGRLTEEELRAARREWSFVPDSAEALERCLTSSGGGVVSGRSYAGG